MTSRKRSTRVGKAGSTLRKAGHRSSKSIAALKDFDVAKVLKGFSLVDDAEIEAAAKLKTAEGGKSVLAPGPFELGQRSVALLALGFGRGAPGDLIVPYSPARKA